MMIIYKHPETNDTQIVKVPWLWMFTPWCAIDLLLKGKIMHALVGWIPLFALIWMFKYESILSSVWESKGYVRS
tara:strand:+ start:189 stop:410 length:222 start_codon:yes stop_codon:yes gene_type:complete